MKIRNDRKLIDIKREFKQQFPYLKIEFYAHGHKKGAGSAASDQLDSELLVGAIRKEGKEGDLILDPEQTISQLEEKFAKEFNLNVQVFRKSGNQWLQTGATDGWTLEVANTKGEHSSDHFHRKYG